MATIVLTVLGDDRPGLVSALSAPISAHGASWERSRLSRLAGKFAGIVVVDVADDRAAALLTDLEALGRHGLHVVVEGADAGPDQPHQRLELALLGADHPGIVAEISASLAELGVSIEELTTDVQDAPMAGGTLFEARALLTAPAGTTLEELRTLLEGLADELMVDIALSVE